jgi:hypothetical protein
LLLNHRDEGVYHEATPAAGSDLPVDCLRRTTPTPGPGFHQSLIESIDHLFFIADRSQDTLRARWFLVSIDLESTSASAANETATRRILPVRVIPGSLSTLRPLTHCYSLSTLSPLSCCSTWNTRLDALTALSVAEPGAFGIPSPTRNTRNTRLDALTAMSVVEPGAFGIPSPNPEHSEQSPRCVNGYVRRRTRLARCHRLEHLEFVPDRAISTPPQALELPFGFPMLYPNLLSIRPWLQLD